MDNKVLTFLIQDSSDIDEMAKILKESPDSVLQCMMDNGLTVNNIVSQYYITQLAGIARSILAYEYDTVYDYLVTLGVGRDGNLYKRIYTSQESGSSSSSYEEKREIFFNFADKNRFVYYKTSARNNVNIYRIYKNNGRYVEFFDERAPKELKEFIGIDYFGVNASILNKLQLAMITLFADYDTMTVIEFDKLFTQYLPLLLKKASFHKPVDEKEKELAISALNYIKQLLNAKTSSSESTNGAIIEGIVAKYNNDIR